MALTEDINTCAICNARPANGRVGGIPMYCCYSCFRLYKDSILAGEPWVLFLINAEKQRRKRRNRLLDTTGLPVFVSLQYIPTAQEAV